MQEALLLVFVIMILLISLVYISTKKEGFDTSEVTAAHSSFIADRLNQYGNVGISLLTAGRVGALGESATAKTTTIGTNIQHPLNTKPTGLFSIIKTCEAITTMDCSAFDDPNFSLNCGVCLDVGKNSDDKPIPGGGLVLLEDDKISAKQNQVSDFMPNYVPTIGFCPANKLVSTKEECVKLQRRLLCQKNQSFDLPGCSQCFSNGSYSIIDPKESPGVVVGRGTLGVVGVGVLTIQEQGFPPITGITLSKTSAYTHDLRVEEGGTVRLIVNPDSGNRSPVYIAGYIYGSTFSGEFDMDIMILTLTDNVTGRKPRSAGSTKIENTPVTKMAPGFGQTTMSLLTTIPFTFVDTAMQESYLCQNGPYITKPSSVAVLESDPCYAKGAAPGKYSLECLQNIWMSNGCTESGKYYPSNASTASLLMSKPNGSFRTLNDIADFIYNQALITSTGIDENGVSQKLRDWSSASVFCTGVAITSPCMGPATKTGPLPTECLSYLWNNLGANNSDGPTYTIAGGTSLDGTTTNPQFCQSSGTLSPIDANGKVNEPAIKWWQTKGGVDSVKKIMSGLYAAANAPGSTDEERAPYFTQCYGPLRLANRPPLPPPPPPKVYTCPESTTKIVSTRVKLTKGNIIIPKFTIGADYTFSMFITPRGPVNEWSSLLHMTTGQDSGPFGSRVIAIFLYPGSITKLAIHIDHSTQPGWAARVNDQLGLTVPFTVGTTSQLVIKCSGSNITITVDGTICGTFTHDGMRYRGNVTVYASNPWYPPSNCFIETICYGGISRATSLMSEGSSVSSEIIIVTPPSKGLFYSKDGARTWTETGINAFPPSLESRVYFIVNNGSQWLAGGPSSRGTRLATSRDGITWTEVASMVNRGAAWSAYYSAVWTGDSWIMMELLLPSYQTKPLYSYDGISWSEMEIGVNSYVTQIALGKSTLVAVCGGIKRRANPENHAIYYSLNNGDSWDFAPGVDDYFGGESNLQCVGFNGTYFLAGGCATGAGYPSILLYSPDGVNWRKTNFPEIQARIWSVKSNGRMWILSAAYDGLFYSTDTVNWTRSYHPATRGNTWPNGQVHGMKWTGTAWLVPCNNAVLTSPDGINWTKVDALSTICNNGADVIG